MMDNSVISHLRNGGMVIIYDSDDREAEGDFAFCGHCANPSAKLQNAFIEFGMGNLNLVDTERI